MITKHSTKTPRTITGFFGVLGGLLTSRGSGAPSANATTTPKITARGARGVVLISLTCLGLSFTTGIAQAAPLENPEALAPTEVKAETATLQGTLSPHTPGEVGSTYEFRYKVGAVCTGESATKAVTSIMGLEAEPVSEAVTALKPNTEYTVCLVVHNAAKTEEAVSAPLPFTTAPEPPTTEKATLITASTATFHGVLNPKVEATAGYEFAYSTSGVCTEGLATSLVAEAKVKAEAVKAEVTGLEPNQKYTVCLVATNAAGAQFTAGNPVTVETLPLAPEIGSVSASTSPPEPTTNAAATEATVEAIIEPNNEPTTCRVEYGTTSLSEHTTACVQTLRGFGEQSATARLKGLTQKTTYKYEVIAENATGKEEGTEATFETTSPEPPQVSAATGVTATTALLNGALNPKHAGVAGEYEFVYRHSPVAACTGEGEEKTAPALDLGAEHEAAGPTEVKNLAPGTRYAYCLRAHAEGEALSSSASFTTLPLAPSIVAESESDSGVTASGAKLSATVTPGGPETPYRVTIQYGPNTEYGSTLTLPEQEAGFGVTEVHLEEQLADLEPNTTYHFRFVISNATAPAGVPGPDQTFTTQSTSTEVTLPDNRAYEMVTPVQKQGSLFEDTGPIRAAASGDAIADVATLPTEDAPQGNGETLISILSTRTSSGWESRTIAAPHPFEGPAEELQPEYLFFNEDLSSAVVEPPSAGYQKLSPQATESTPYLHTLFFNGNVSEPCDVPYTSAQSCYAPLVSPSDDTHIPLEPFGELTANGLCVETFRCGPRVRGGTPDMSHLVLTSHAPLTSTPAPTGTPSEREGQPDIYEYSNGQLQLLSILPGQTEGSAGLELAGRVGIGASGEGKGAVASRHAISDNGSRVVMDEKRPEGGNKSVVFAALYLRDVVKGETIRLDVGVEEGSFKPEESVEPEYVDANAEGTKIFFLDGAKLTAGSGAHGSPGFDGQDRPDLYECAITEENGKDHCALTDLTPETNHESARVATVLGVSEDGSYVYFAAGGGLGIAPRETEPGGCKVQNFGEGEEPSETALCNVFVRHDGVTRFVAALSQQDNSDWTNGPSLTGQDVRVSPNGEWLAFSSHRDLTGYDNAASNGTNCGTYEGSFGELLPLPLLCGEVFEYDAATETLSCASCNPTGARPTGGASVPGWTQTFKKDFQREAYYQPRYLSDEGRLFFNSPDALLPLDVSKQNEVFEYEPVGAGTCTEATSSGSELYVPGEHGCVALISTGTASKGSQFLEAAEGAGVGEHGEAGSAAGRDVFFLTSEKVLPQDVDTAPDVYDAHECTTQSPCIAPPSALRPCETEASCKAPPSPQPTIYGAPASATFTGPGNLIPPPAVVPKKVTKKTTKCKKGDVKNKKGKCVKKPKKKKTKAKKSAHTNRRSSR
jgi:hypothetical protein